MIRFSLIGPLRTGSSLLSRCLDDHPELICLCESEINRALFGEMYVKLHFQRMRKHGLHPFEIIGLLDRKKQNSTGDYELWHQKAVPILAEKYGKSGILGIGDKSPDFYRTPDLARHVEAEHILVYTMRDPRAIYRSVWADRTPEDEKENRWSSFKANFEFWKESLAGDNVCIVRYEDLLSDSEKELRRIFAHLGVEHSSAYRESFPRVFPDRFLWKSVTENADKGVEFVLSKSDFWREELSADVVSRIQDDPAVREVLDRFGYEIL